MEKIKYKLRKHFYASWRIYLLVGLSFLLGLCFGFWGMSALGEKQTVSLNKLFEEGVKYLEVNSNFTTLARQAVVRNLINWSKFFLLGLTVIGLPFILIFIFTRGFVLGFTLKFLLQEQAWRGGVVALLAVLPPNLLSLPAYFCGAVVAVNFSIYLSKGTASTKMSQCLGEYLFIMFCLMGLLLGSALIEGYFSPIFIKLFPRFKG